MSKADRLNSLTMPERLVKFAEWLHQGHCKIRDKGKIIPLIPNSLQKRIMDTMFQQAHRQQPIRLIILKDRKPGCSTFIQALAYFLTKFTDHWMSQVVAHSRDDTRNIFSISHRIWRFDELEPRPEKPARAEIEWKDNDSRFVTRTAGGEYISRGATLDFLHLSEVPMWPGDKQSVSQQLAGLLDSMHDSPETLCVFESTAQMADSTMEFESRWYDAVQEKSIYAAVFHAWHENPNKQARVRGDGLGDLEPHEKEMRDRYSVTDEQIQWYRDKLADHRGDLRLMRQEHPSNPEEAFQVATGRIYSMLEKDVHHKHIPVDLLFDAQYECYRGIDWGGAHPFVCLWIAYKPSSDMKAFFTIDVQACPNTWKQLVQYHYEDSGRPAKKDDDTCDALRYAVTHFALIAGHVHVYREMFLPESAQAGLSDLDHAEEIMASQDGIPVLGTVADPSQPKTINLVNSRGLGVATYERKGAYIKDVKDGISHLKALMRGTIPLVHVPDPEPEGRRVMRLQRSMPFGFSVPDFDLVVEMDRYQRHNAVRTGDRFGF